MTEETVTVTFSMLQEDAEALKRANENKPIVATFDHHAEPIRIAFGEVHDVELTSRNNE